MPRRRRAEPTSKRTTTGDGVTVVGKNPNGAGSVYFDRTVGKWRATYRDGASRRTVTGATAQGAEQRRDELVAQLEAASANGLLGANPTVGEMTDYYIEHVMDVRPNTAWTYRNQGVHIKRLLGDVPIRDLTIERVQLFQSQLRHGDETTGDPALSERTVIGVRGRLLQVAKQAVKHGYLPANPVLEVAPPKIRPGSTVKPKRILTPDECRQLVVAAAGHWLGAAVSILFLMGNRSSEVLGLAWGDIDFDAGTATVRRGSTYATGHGMRLDDPKTAGTSGVHILPPTVLALLEARQAAQQVERREAGLAWRTTTYRGAELDMVFTNPNGTLVLAQHLHKAVRACCALAGVDPANVGTHSGRRAVVTALFVDGVELGDIARHVGHGSDRTTAGYVGDLGRRPADTAARAATLLDPKAT